MKYEILKTSPSVIGVVPFPPRGEGYLSISTNFDNKNLHQKLSSINSDYLTENTPHPNPLPFGARETLTEYYQ